MTRPLRIVYLSRYLPSSSETFVLDEALAVRRAGAEVRSVALDWAPRTVRHGRFEEIYRQTEVVPRPSNPLTAYASLVMDNHSLMPMVRAHWSSVGRPQDLRRATWLARRLRNLDVDVLRVHHAAETARYGAVVSLLSGIPLSLAVHGRDLFVPTSDLGWILSHAAHVSTITPFHRERLLRAGLPSEQVGVLPCAVDPPEEVAGPPDSKALRVLTVGRLVPKKGHDLLIKACAELAGRGRQVELVVVGGGSEGNSLRQLANRCVGASSGRLRVEFRGETPTEEVRSLMLHGGFVCFALACRIAPDGDRDGLPVALLEAQACGLPTVTTNLPGFGSQLVDDRGGILLPLEADRRRVMDSPGPERGSLAAALACLDDVPVLRERLARGARAAAEARPGTDAIGRRLLDTLQRLLPGGVYDARPSEGG